MNNTLLCLIASAGLGLGACQTDNPTTTNTREMLPEPDASGLPSGLKPGMWRGVLLSQGQEIPFLFGVNTLDNGQKLTVTLHNGEERLTLDDITTAGDSTTIRLGKSDAALVLRADGQDKLKGTWVKYDSKTPQRVPLTATRGAQPLFPVTQRNSRGEFGGAWRATFVDKKGRSYPAVGVFTQKDGCLTGAFSGPGGDYRSLSGSVDGQEFRLSRFDGNQALLFTARNGPPEPIDITKEYAPNTLFGDFYSGKSGHETWTAVPDPTAKPPKQ